LTVSRTKRTSTIKKISSKRRGSGGRDYWGGYDAVKIKLDGLIHSGKLRAPIGDSKIDWYYELDCLEGVLGRRRHTDESVNCLKCLLNQELLNLIT
jgi:hypothetical protein